MTNAPLVERVRRFYDDNPDKFAQTRPLRRYFRATLTRVLRARVPEGQRVLEIDQAQHR
jgi:hypothetical protein